LIGALTEKLLVKKCLKAALRGFLRFGMRRSISGTQRAPASIRTRHFRNATILHIISGSDTVAL
jgi:hypothetical protein